MLENIVVDSENKMKNAMAALKHDLSRMRTGRASPSLIEHVMVNYYGNPTQLSQVANISVQDARTLAITAWEKNMIPAIEKAIHTSDLGLNPVTNGDVIRIPLPSLTEERRKEFVRSLKSVAEQARVSVRNARRDANAKLKTLLKDKEIAEDDERRCEDRIQKLTDKYIVDIDAVFAAKETDIMSV